MKKFSKKAIVVHSGGMDSSTCLSIAIRDFGRENVLSLTFSYGQRNSRELDRATAICQLWNVDHVVLDISCLSEITENSLTRHDLPFQWNAQEKAPNSLVTGRNGLMARIAAIHANHIGAQVIYMGVMELEKKNGYRDCSRNYMNKMEEILRIDLADDAFEIRTPLVDLTKAQAMDVAKKLGILEYLLETTITCYEGLDRAGCRKCPACALRNEGILDYLKINPEFQFSFRDELSLTGESIEPLRSSLGRPDQHSMQSG